MAAARDIVHQLEDDASSRGGLMEGGRMMRRVEEDYRQVQPMLALYPRRRQEVFDIVGISRQTFLSYEKIVESRFLQVSRMGMRGWCGECWDPAANPVVITLYPPTNDHTAGAQGGPNPKPLGGREALVQEQEKADREDGQGLPQESARQGQDQEPQADGGLRFPGMSVCVIPVIGLHKHANISLSSFPHTQPQPLTGGGGGRRGPPIPPVTWANGTPTLPAGHEFQTLAQVLNTLTERDIKKQLQALLNATFPAGADGRSYWDVWGHIFEELRRNPRNELRFLVHSTPRGGTVIVGWLYVDRFQVEGTSVEAFKVPHVRCFGVAESHKSRGYGAFLAHKFLHLHGVRQGRFVTAEIDTYNAASVQTLRRAAQQAGRTFEHIGKMVQVPTSAEHPEGLMLLWGEEGEDDDDTNSYVMALPGADLYKEMYAYLDDPDASAAVRTGKGRKPKGVVTQRKRSQVHAWQTRTTGQRANR